MKKPYSKPMVTFEEYSLDMPIAAGCDPSAFDEAKELKAQDWFDDSCYNKINDDFLDKTYGDDKICYYTLSSQLFTS